MRKLLGQQLGPREVDEILRDVDVNGDGLVDFEGTCPKNFGPYLSKCLKEIVFVLSTASYQLFLLCRLEI